MAGKIMTRLRAEMMMEKLTGVQDLICALEETAEASKVSPEALGVVADVMNDIRRDLQADIDGVEDAKATA